MVVLRVPQIMCSPPRSFVPGHGRLSSGHCCVGTHQCNVCSCPPLISREDPGSFSHVGQALQGNSNDLDRLPTLNTPKRNEMEGDGDNTKLLGVSVNNNR